MKTLEQWTVDELEDEVASISARIAVATGRMLECLGELDRRGVVDEGFVSLAHWLHWRTGLRLPSAREHVRVARALRDLPKIQEALTRGEISYSKVRAITRIATQHNEAQLVSMAQGGSTSQLERVVRSVRRVGLDAKDEAVRVAAKRYLKFSHDDDGMLVIQGRLSAEEGALLMKAMEVARSQAFQAKAPCDRAAQLMGVAERSLTCGEPRAGGDRTLVVVHVDEDVLKDASQDGRCQLEDGPGVSAEACRRMACDASTVEMKHGEDGRVVDAGRRKRRLSSALQRAVVERDQGHCVFPGCVNQIVDGHHVEHWADGGESVLENVYSLCRTHHVLVHEGGWKMQAGEAARFFRPDGREFLRTPPKVDISELEALENERWRLVTHGWRDEVPDYQEAVASVL